MKLLLCLFAAFLFSKSACQHQNSLPPAGGVSAEAQNTGSSNEEKQVGGDCECCEAMHDGMPGKLNWQTTIAPPGEPGERMEISGTIFQKDGKTPAQGVIFYVYHTDNEGNYSRGNASTDCGKRHGLLRGWMKTDATGRYKFTSIRPASYPGTNALQHIHPIIKEPGIGEYWIDEYWFDDDPNMKKNATGHVEKRGGSGIVHLTKNPEGTWMGKRDIVLGLNVPGY